MKKKTIIGTRSSKLALWQANWVKLHLEKLFPEREFALQGFSTKGDQILNVSLAKIGDKGLFTRELEAGLLSGEVDLAVHSLKDLPTALPQGLIIGAFCSRENPLDVLAAKKGLTLEQLPQGARIGTSSLRRTAQLLACRPDLQIEVIRGNVPTRLQKLKETDLAGIVLAYAGVHRLGLDAEISQILEPEICLPAIGQGIVALEIAADNAEMVQVAAALDDLESRDCGIAERAFMRKLEGGCQVPMGALAQIDGQDLLLSGMVADLKGERILRASCRGSRTKAEFWGETLAQSLLEQGAEEILEKVRELTDGK